MKRRCYEAVVTPILEAFQELCPRRVSMERRPLNLPDTLLAYTPCARCLFSEILIGCDTFL